MRRDLRKRILIHICIAIVCTTIGVSVWMYRANILFPVEPQAFHPKEQFLKHDDLLQPDDMIEDFDYLAEVIESVHPGPYNQVGETKWNNIKSEISEKTPDSTNRNRLLFHNQ